MLLGLPLAFIVTRVLGSELIGVSAGDPLVFAAILIVLALAGVLGCAVPARRAMRVDPIVALRYE
jgi:ABC-type antimicrobial peptide transport system permease subunit